MTERKNKADGADVPKAPRRAPEDAGPVTPEVTDTTKAAPMDPPPQKVRVEQETPTIPAANAVAPHAPHNSTAVRLLDAEGSEVAVGEFLEYPDAEDPGSLVTVNRRVYREYTHANAVTKTTHLLYPAGARITKAEAARLKDEIAQANGVPQNAGPEGAEPPSE